MTAPLVVVSVSGGKDSTATLVLALDQVPRDRLRAVFADTGNEHELTYQYVRDYLPTRLGVPIHEVRADFTDWMARRREYVTEHWPAKGVPPDVIQRVLGALHPTGNPYLDLCLIKGRFPSRKAQFCTEFLKTEPLSEYQGTLIAKHGAIEAWQGVRADESASRAQLPARDDRGGGLVLVRPILRWSVADVFAHLATHAVEPNPLYRQGMSRVGCMPCIHAKKDELLAISHRYPGHLDRIEAWEAQVALASKRQESSFFPDPEEDAHLHRRGIRNMVQWAATTRGGVQYGLFRQGADEPGCASAYGLCE